MTLLAAVLAVATAAVLVEQDAVGEFGVYTGERGKPVRPNFRIGDLDGDSMDDLLLPDRIVLREGDRFTRSATHLIPDFGPYAICDNSGRDIYLRLPSRLEIIRWSDGEWLRTLSQDITWPPVVFADATDQSGNRLGSFVRDLNSDGAAELVVPAADGIHVFERDGAFFTPRAVLDVFPKPKVVMGGIAPIGRGVADRIWPDQLRTALFPTRGMTCNFWWEHDALTVVDPGTASKTDGLARTRFTVDPASGYALAATTERVGLPQGNVEGFQAVRLNDDGVLDAIKIEESIDAVWSGAAPTVSIQVSTDGGATIQRFLFASLGRFSPFIDLNGDGRKDLVSYTTEFFGAGMREALIRATTKRELPYHLEVRLQDVDGRFADQPDSRSPVTFVLDRAPIHGTRMLWLFLDGALADLNGDFNADGWRDLAIHDTPDRIAVYLGSAGGFSREPFAAIPAQPSWIFGVDDVDGDGRSDIVIPKRGHLGERLNEQGKLFLLREPAP